MVKFLGFWPPFVFGEHLKEIGIAKILLRTKTRHMGKFQGCRCQFYDV